MKSVPTIAAAALPLLLASTYRGHDDHTSTRQLNKPTDRNETEDLVARLSTTPSTPDTSTTCARFWPTTSQ
jgi:hypothetical protein